MEGHVLRMLCEQPLEPLRHHVGPHNVHPEARTRRPWWQPGQDPGQDLGDKYFNGLPAGRRRGMQGKYLGIIRNIPQCIPAAAVAVRGAGACLCVDPGRRWGARGVLRCRTRCSDVRSAASAAGPQPLVCSRQPHKATGAPKRTAWACTKADSAHHLLGMWFMFPTNSTPLCPVHRASP